MSELARILIVDDDPSFVETYRDLLGAEGYLVEDVATAARAREVAAKTPFDVVILDQKLRGEGGPNEGIDLVLGLAATGAKVIIATAYADDATIDRAFRDGAYDYLQKGPRLAALLRAKVRNALEVMRERELGRLTPSDEEAAVRRLWQDVLTEADSNRKGALLEQFVAHLLRLLPGFEQAWTNRENEQEEIDVVVRNESTDVFIRDHFGSHLLVECKYWSKPVGKTELILFREKLANRFGFARVGLFVAVGGYARTFQAENLASRKGDTLVIALDRADVQALLDSRDRLATLKDFHTRAVVAEAKS